MRRVLGLVVLLAALLLSGNAEAQCNGCGIGYWYNGVPATGGTMTGPILLPAGSAAAPSLAHSSFPGTGMHFIDGFQILYLATAGVDRLKLDSTGWTVRSDAAFAWGSTSVDSARDVIMVRDAANTLALRNGGTNGTPAAQTFNVYNFCDGAQCATGYERTYITHDGTYAIFGSASGGTGSLGAIRFSVGGDAFQLSTAYFRPVTTDTAALGAGTLQFTDAYLGRSIQGSKTKALTEGAATTVATVAVPQTAGSNFAAGEVRYAVYASDGTDTQTLNGSAFFSAVNKAGTETCQLTDDQIGTEAASAGTLVCTVACATGLTDVVGITFDCTSSLTQTSLNALVRFDMQQPNTLAFP